MDVTLLTILGLGVLMSLIAMVGGLFIYLPEAHLKIPQELGDFGAMVHAGYSRKRALLYNFVSALTFPFGGLIAYFAGRRIDVPFLIALGVGNFIYIASADLIPEVKRVEQFSEAATRFTSFALGAGFQYAAHAVHT